ncbi:uncharacterized protein N7487_000977 [Penicillium crustosum]|uniref:uncharacterized protein n=1 Tax=Penicillium crustosum TaxID=36656 RepID=UPI00239EB7F1|nr:uncharacterized protein N7487_000977 [Penicillium crustosum]KAJ5417427.1 hypothetical protein N7487_000977 [Penicillium crustosum]
MSTYNRYPLDTISEEITPTDHYILCGGGTSSCIERLPSRIQQYKKPPSSRQQIEDLTYEISYLRAELQWQRESREIFLRFQRKMFEIFGMMEDELAQSTTRLEEARSNYLGLWDVDPKVEDEVKAI